MQNLNELPKFRPMNLILTPLHYPNLYTQKTKHPEREPRLIRKTRTVPVAMKRAQH
jgi:hypothetical protein